MTYVTHKERRALVMLATALAVMLISLATVAAIRSAGTPCSHGPASFDTCTYALR